MTKRLNVPFFFDFKSPFSYLAKDSVYRLQRQYNISVEFLPYDFSRRQPEIFQPSMRNDVAWAKIRYFYKDVRRFANERSPPVIIKGPLKLFDSTCANVGGLYCRDRSQDMFKAYVDYVFEKFFLRELDIEDENVMCNVIDTVADHCNVSNAGRQSFLEYLHGQGPQDILEIEKRADSMDVFGVPTIFVEQEMYFGNDRMHFVEKHLKELGLQK